MKSLAFLPLVLTLMTYSLTPSAAHAAEPPPPPTDGPRLLADLERRTFTYFIEQAHPRTGLVQDRAPNFKQKSEYHVASMAATGFGLAALVIGAKRNYLPRKEAYRRALRSLQSTARMTHHHGWFFHFVEWDTGERAWNSEVSTIDTALWAAGALAAGAYFKGTEVDQLAQRLYRRMEFNWMRTDGGAKPDELILSMGWTPEQGFLKSRWHEYSEHTLLGLLALSSPTHPVPESAWTAWERDSFEVGPYRAYGLDLPMFVHQYVHCFVNLKGRADVGGDDYWANSVTAHRANRWFCTHWAAKFPGLGPNGWGISAVDGPDGYRAYSLKIQEVDGTLSPIGVAAALPFMPKESLDTLVAMYREHGERIWGRYGFSAYNEARNWRGDDMVGIDAGAALLMLDRHRYREAVIPALLERTILWRGLKRAGFRKLPPKT